MSLCRQIAFSLRYPMPTEYIFDSSGTYVLVRQDDPNACGLAAVAAVMMARMFICPKDPPTEQSLLEKLGGTIPQGGYTRTELDRLLTLLQIPHRQGTFNDTSTFLPALRDNIRPRKPAILHLKGSAGGHWVAAVSTRDNTLVVLDPMYGLQLVLFGDLPGYASLSGVEFSGQCIFTT